MMRLIIPFILFCIVFSWNPLTNACEFETGVSLRNEDNVTYKIHYSPMTSTTRICWIKKPTDKIKNGIGWAHHRKIKGFKILEEKSSGILSSILTAAIDPHTEVCCLCVNRCTIKIEKIGKFSVGNGKTIVIKHGQAYLQ